MPDLSDTKALPGISQAIACAAAQWPPFFGGDPNLVDVLHVAEVVAQLLEVRLPTALPSKEVGIALVECVEQLFIHSSLIRTLPTAELVRRAHMLASETLRVSSLVLGGIQDVDRVGSLVVSLYTWHGTISMAKCLRPHDSAGHAYTLELRLCGYEFLGSQIDRVLPEGRPWIRHGISLARQLEAKRGNTVSDDWVPADSPYWQ